MKKEFRYIANIADTANIANIANITNIANIVIISSKGKAPTHAVGAQNNQAEMIF